MWIKHVLPPAYRSLQEAEEVGVELARALGCGSSSGALKDMRSRGEEELIAAARLDTGLLPGGMHFGPVVDGRLLPDRPEKLFKLGKQHHADLIVGSNRDEANFFLAALDLSKSEYEELVRRMAGEWSQEALRLFPAGDDARVYPALSGMITAFEFTAPCRFLARCVGEGSGASFLYHFTRVPPTERGRALCSCHGSEIPYVFGVLDRGEGYGDRDLELSASMMDYWINFARSGDPNGTGLPAWPAYSQRTDLSLEFGDDVVSMSGLQRDACDLAERIHLAGL